MDKEIREKVISQAVKESVEKVVGEYGLKNAIVHEVAKKAADIFWEKNQLEILKLIDLDTVVRLATLDLIKRVTHDLR